MPLSVVFFGTPEVAVPSLESLQSSGHSIAGVVTAPDRPRGRGMEVGPSPIKTLATDMGIDVFQPDTLKEEETQRLLEGFGVDVFVVVAFGLILPKAVLAIPRLGCMNVHFSLLPRFRGPAPVQRALIEGMTLTGVTIMQLDEGVDTGPTLAEIEEPIFDDDTAGSLEARLAVRGAGLLVQVLDSIENEVLHPSRQNDSMASRAPKIGSADARIAWSMPGAEIRNRVRAFNPKPGAWATFRGKRLKIWQVSVSNDTSTGEPGTLDVVGERIVVDTGGDRLVLEQLQPEGSKRMSSAEFARGFRPESGERIE